MVLARLTGALIYLAGTAVWTLLMLLFGALRCDDSCSADSTSWGDDASAWQYDVVPYLGLVGLLLAIVALTLSLAGRQLGLLVVALHAGVFLVNAVLILESGNVNGAVVVVPAILAVLAAFVAVGGIRSAPS